MVFGSSSKGQGMSLNVIIVAVIALIVLVVLVITFTGKYRIFGKSTISCEAKGSGARCLGSCPATDLTDLNTDCKQRYPDGKTATEPGPKCCIPFMDTAEAPKKTDTKKSSSK